MKLIPFIVPTEEPSRVATYNKKLFYLQKDIKNDHYWQKQILLLCSERE